MEKELIRLASLVGTDSKNAEKKLLDFIKESYTSNEDVEQMHYEYAMYYTPNTEVQKAVEVGVREFVDWYNAKVNEERAGHHINAKQYLKELEERL